MIILFFGHRPVHDVVKFGIASGILPENVRINFLDEVLKNLNIGSLVTQLLQKYTLIAQLEQKVIKLWNLNDRLYIVRLLSDNVKIIQKLCFQISLRNPLEKYAQYRWNLNQRILNYGCLETHIQ